jgi:hypothetical protein
MAAAAAAELFNIFHCFDLEYLVEQNRQEVQRLQHVHKI